MQESPQIPRALPQKLTALPCVNGITARPEPRLGSNAAAHRQPSQPPPSGHARQQQPAQVLASYPSQGLTPQQQHAALPQLQARQLSPSPLHASPANLNPNQQQLLLQKQQQAQRQQQQQQQQPISASPSPQAGVPLGPHQPQAQQALGYQQSQASLPPPQQQQLWHGVQATAAQGQVRRQAETVGQPNRPKSTSPPQGIPPNAQAQQQLLNLQQQLRLQRQLPQQLPQQQAHGQGGYPHAGWAQPSQAHSLQQIQAMQAQLTGQMQGQDQGQVAAALPQHGFSQPPGQGQHAYGMPQLSFSQGQVRQGQAPAALPLARPGQLPAFSPARGQPPARPGPTMVSPTASSSGSAAPPPTQPGDKYTCMVMHLYLICMAYLIYRNVYHVNIIYSTRKLQAITLHTIHTHV